MARFRTKDYGRRPPPTFQQAEHHSRPVVQSVATADEREEYDDDDDDLALERRCMCLCDDPIHNYHDYSLGRDQCRCMAGPGCTICAAVCIAHVLLAVVIMAATGCSRFPHTCEDVLYAMCVIIGGLAASVVTIFYLLVLFTFFLSCSYWCLYL